MSHLESIIVEYLDWQGYLVHRNTKVGRLKHGGWEMELDLIGYNPHNSDLVHYEPSIDAQSWDTREARYVKKFHAARRPNFTEVFSRLPPETSLRQIAVFPSHPKGRDTIAVVTSCPLMRLSTRFDQRSLSVALLAAVPYLRTIRCYECCSFPTVARTMRYNLDVWRLGM